MLYVEADWIGLAVVRGIWDEISQRLVLNFLAIQGS